MADRSKISWTDASWNPVRGCSRVSPGCDNCYAIGVAHRYKWGDGLTRIRRSDGEADWSGELHFIDKTMEQPLRWRRPRKVFVCSGADLFHDKVPFEYIGAIFGVMGGAPDHRFQVLTKRPGRARDFFRWLESHEEPPWEVCLKLAGRKVGRIAALNAALLWSKHHLDTAWPFANVWLGVSVEDQQRAEERLPLLMECPASVHWVSAEPLLEHVNLHEWLPAPPHSRALAHTHRTGHPVGGDENSSDCFKCKTKWTPQGPAINWLVVGGESGPGARPFDLGWAEVLRDQCDATGAAFFLKQLGAFAQRRVEHEDGHTTSRIRTEDRKGENPSEWPRDLRIREYPKEQEDDRRQAAVR